MNTGQTNQKKSQTFLHQLGNDIPAFCPILFLRGHPPWRGGDSIGMCDQDSGMLGATVGTAQHMGTDEALGPEPNPNGSPWKSVL